MRHKKTKLKRLTLGIALCLGTMGAPNLSHASLQGEMDRFFGDMSNVTPPGVFENQRRGVISGGRYTTKSKIFDENLAYFAPPSWKGGCGGIDMFNGSFSFISADQIVQLLRQVAANAKGYAFQIALDSVCKSCASTIETFQKKIQSLNQHLGNSCQLAQGLVNDTLSATEITAKTDASLVSTLSGLADDFFSSRDEVQTSKSPEEQMSNQELIDKGFAGNIIWMEMQKQGTQNWFSYGDKQLLELIMSLTGTVIRHPPENGQDGAQTVVTKPGKSDMLHAMLYGGSIKAYKCDDLELCMNPVDQNVTIKGFSEKIRDLLIGTNSSPGIIDKYAKNYGRPTDEEIAFLSNLPQEAGTIIRNLSTKSQQSAQLFAMQASDAIALSMVYVMTEEMIRAASLTLSQSQAKYARQAIEQLNESRDKIRQDYLQLRSDVGDLPSMMERYGTILKNSRQQQYAQESLSLPKK